MFNAVTKDKKLEAICKGCNKTLTVSGSQINQKFSCKFCGYTSTLTKDLLLHTHPVFSQGQTKAPSKKLNYAFTFLRHGFDEPQKALLMDLQSNELEFVTKTKLAISSKISFMLKDRKFIVNVQSVKALSTAEKEKTLYAIQATLEIVVPVTKRTQSPHYLIR